MTLWELHQALQKHMSRHEKTPVVVVAYDVPHAIRAVRWNRTTKRIEIVIGSREIQQ